MFKKLCVAVLVIALGGIFIGCSSKSKSKEVKVYAAASLSESLEQISKEYKQTSDINMLLSLAGSNKLRVQIEEGADADIFISANKEQYDKLKDADFIDEGREFLQNSLVVITPKENKAQINSLEDLETKSCKIVLADKEVPVGSYSLKVLDKLNNKYGVDYSNKVLDKVVSREADVKKVLNKIELDEGDVGIVYKSDIYEKEDKVNVIEIPNEFNIKASYWIGKISKSKNKDERDKAYNYILNNNTVFEKYGYEAVK